MDAMSVEFLVAKKRVIGEKWGESIGGEIYIPQHHVVEGNNTLAS
jgi:hypothetical protein